MLHSVHIFRLYRRLVSWYGMRMRIVAIVLLLAGGVCLCSCRRVDMRTARIYVPAMKNRASAEWVVNAVARIPGVQRDKLQVNMETRDVIVPYDSINLSLKNIEFAIAGVGFDADDVPADPTAARNLPAECK